MKKILLLVALLWGAAPARAQTPAPNPKRITLVLHGGAGTITRANLTPEKEKAYTEALQQALQVGYAILSRGGTALDAVEATVRFLEDSPLFNAGRGAVFTHAGRNELDAAIMNGQSLQAGAVAGVTVVRNPISAARAVMEQSEHVLLAGPGAEEFAREKGLELVEPGYFFTQARYTQLQQALAREQRAGTPDPLSTPTPDRPIKAKAKTRAGKPAGAVLPGSAEENIFTEGRKYGTVGAVALDQFGNLAAATSTGGMTNKRYGRIGDAPLIGCGTYADNRACAVSCTGWGEFFIRGTVARDVAARMEFQHLPLQQAAQATLDRVAALGGDGGLIALDSEGNITMPFNSEGMYRAFIRADGLGQVQIYR